VVWVVASTVAIVRIAVIWELIPVISWMSIVVHAFVVATSASQAIVQTPPAV